MFDELSIQDARPILWMKRVFVFVIVALLAIGMVSSHRAYFQVRSLELNAPHSLTAGSVVNVSVVGSGRTQVDVDVDLIQGPHSERLHHLHLSVFKCFQCARPEVEPTKMKSIDLAADVVD